MQLRIALSKRIFGLLQRREGKEKGQSLSSMLFRRAQKAGNEGFKVSISMKIHIFRYFCVYNYQIYWNFFAKLTDCPTVFCNL